MKSAIAISKCYESQAKSAPVARSVRVACACAVFAFISMHALAADDVVHFQPDEPGKTPYTLRGEITEFTGKLLTLASRTGRPRDYPSERVARIETVWPEDYLAGIAAVQAKEFAEAERRFQSANREERRPWARRMILAELVSAAHNAGHDELAGDVFLSIAQSDPTTQAFDRMPLAWFATESVSEAKATAWAGRNDLPAAVLLAASYLLSTQHRSAAIGALKNLATTSDDARVAALAAAQLWRADVVSIQADDVVRWRSRIESTPPSVRGGPYFVLGQALERLGDHDAAALAYLRAPIHFSRDRRLSARALLAAAGAMEKAGHPNEAARLLHELVREYGESADRAEAERRLIAFDSNASR